MTVNDVSHIVTWAIFGLSWLFVILHTILSLIERAPWWSTALGWILVTAVASLGIVTGFRVVTYLDADIITHASFQWSYLGAVFLIAGSTLGKIIIRVRLFIKNR